MRRSLAPIAVVVLLLSIFGGLARAGGPKPWKGFPIPADAEAQVPPDDKIAIYELPRPAADVSTEVRASIKKHGWKIESEEPPAQPGWMFAIVKKGKVRLRVKIADGDEGTSGLVLRLPEAGE